MMIVPDPRRPCGERLLEGAAVNFRRVQAELLNRPAVLPCQEALAAQSTLDDDEQRVPQRVRERGLDLNPYRRQAETFDDPLLPGTAEFDRRRYKKALESDDGRSGASPHVVLDRRQRRSRDPIDGTRQKAACLEMLLDNRDEAPMRVGRRASDAQEHVDGQGGVPIFPYAASSIARLRRGHNVSENAQHSRRRRQVDPTFLACHGGGLVGTFALTWPSISAAFN